jgi:hypothetical protein
VDLPVGGSDRSVGRDQDARVAGSIRIAGGLRETSRKDPRVASTRDLRKGVGERSRDGSRRSAEALVTAAILQVLGEDDESGTTGRGVVRHRGRAADVFIEVAGRVELDQGDGKAHTGILPGADSRLS